MEYNSSRWTTEVAKNPTVQNINYKKILRFNNLSQKSADISDFWRYNRIYMQPVPKQYNVFKKSDGKKKKKLFQQSFMGKEKKKVVYF